MALMETPRKTDTVTRKTPACCEQAADVRHVSHQVRFPGAGDLAQAFVKGQRCKVACRVKSPAATSPLTCAMSASRYALLASAILRMRA